MAQKKIVLVFVHGWSVTHTKTYGSLPERLQAEAKGAGIDLQVEEVFLGRYISFHDEVRIADIARAFAGAVEDQLAGLLADGTRFACITHSTGGPVVREWWHRYYLNRPGSGVCPMSHLIMLAPANFGSALAQLGKQRVGRIKAILSGVEPGQGVLDWLELGSAESWELNSAWIASDGKQVGAKGVFPFVLTGQSIDRKLYDNLNTYTGEEGSDGVVRVAAANLSSRYVRLEQQKPEQKPRNKPGDSIEWIAPALEISDFRQSPTAALRVVAGKSHSGADMGIMRSVRKGTRDKASRETVGAILACLQVENRTQYRQLARRFDAESAAVQDAELFEREDRFLLPDSYFFHDRHSMVIFRLHDQEGYPVTDFDLILTAGPQSDPNHLPRGFFADKQRNRLNRSVITYYFNHAAMVGAGPVVDAAGKEVRPALPGTNMLGIKIAPRPGEGFAHYLPCELSASTEMMEAAIQPNSTTLVDICLQRVVYKNVMRLDRGAARRGFKTISPDDEIIED